MKTCKEKALEWNVSPRSVNDMCKKGRIQGAIKEKGSWLIPDDSPKPMDRRKQPETGIATFSFRTDCWHGAKGAPNQGVLSNT